jgi:hypothetical protein
MAQPAQVDARSALVGNRWALTGAVLYLLEWVAIVAASPPGPLGPGTSDSELVDAYAANAGAGAVSAAWFAICLTGRVLYVVGLRSSMSSAERERPLLDLAVAAMAISVTLEVAAYAVAAGAGWIAEDGGDPGLVVAMDRAGFWLNLALFGPIGVSVLAAGWAMLRSRLFPAWLCWVAVGAGVCAMVGCLMTATTAGENGEGGVAEGVTSIAAIAMWLWMIVTGVMLWRRSGRSIAA